MPTVSPRIAPGEPPTGLGPPARPAVQSVAAPVPGPEAGAAVLACLRTTLAAANWHSSAAELVSEISQRLKCLRVSIGWVAAGQLKVVALSDGVVLEEGAAIPELNQAMLEAVHQQATLQWPEPSRSAARITLSHQALFRAQGLCGVVSVPLAHEGRVVGVLTCERSVTSDLLRPQARAELTRTHFEPAEVQWLEQAARDLAPLLALRYELDRPWRERSRALLLTWRQRLEDPRERRLRAMVLAVIFALTVGLLWPLPHRVSASARLEGAVQRVLSAAQDGYLREVHVRPGDVVKAGQLLAELSDDELRSTRQARLAEMAQHENAFAEAFARGDRGQAATAQAKLAEARAQLALAEQQLERVRILAPFDGVVIQGDLRQQLGAPVKRGEHLLTLAPGLDWRVVLEVEEADVGELARGQQAVLRLAAMPGQSIALVLTRVTPVAKSTAEGVRYEVEAAPSGQGAGLAGLRPGLEGVAKVELPARPVLTRWAQRAWQWVALAAWTWF